MSSEDTIAETRAKNLARRELYYRSAMRRSSHKRWQRAREWTGDWHNPVPHGAVASIWRELSDCWHFAKYPDRADWTKVRAYRLEHGVPYLGVPPTPISPDIAGMLPPALQLRLDRIDATLARMESLISEKPMAEYVLVGPHGATAFIPKRRA